MSKTVSVTGTVDDTQMLQAWQRQLKLLDRMEKKMDQVGRNGGRAGRTTQSGFQRAFSQAQKFAGSIGIVSSGLGVAVMVANQLRKEIDNIRSRQAKAADTQKTVAMSQREALFNFGGARGQDLINAVEKISADTGSKQVDLYKTASAALSFKGASISDQEAFDAVRVAAQIDPFNQEEQTSIAQGILAQKKKAGGSAAEVAGFQIAVKQSSPVVSAADFGANIAPGIGDLTQFGNNPRQAGAFLATLGQGIGDSSGRVTRNAAINFAGQLEKLLPGVQGGTLERMAVIQNNDQLRQKMLGTLDQQLRAEMDAQAVGSAGDLTGEAKALPTLIAMLQKDNNETKALLQKTLAAIPELSQGDELLSATLSRVNSETLQQTAIVDQMAAATAEGARARDTAGGRTGAMRQRLGEIFEATGQSKTEQEIQSLLFDAQGGLNNDGVTPALKQLRRLESDLRDGDVVMGSSTGMGSGYYNPSAPVATTRRAATEQELANADQIAQLIKSIQEMVDATQENTRETKQNTTETRTGRDRRPRQSPTADLTRK